MQAMASVFSGDLSVLYRLKALEELYTTPYQEHLPVPPSHERRLAARRAPARAETGPAASSSSSCGRSRQKAAPRDDADPPGALPLPDLPRAPVPRHHRAPVITKLCSVRKLTPGPPPDLRRGQTPRRDPNTPSTPPASETTDGAPTRQGPRRLHEGSGPRRSPRAAAPPSASTRPRPSDKAPGVFRPAISSFFRRLAPSSPPCAPSPWPWPPLSYPSPPGAPPRIWPFLSPRAVSSRPASSSSADHQYANLPQGVVGRRPLT